MAMTVADRRAFLRRAAAAGAFLVGCGDDDANSPSGGTGGGGGGEPCEGDPFVGAEHLGDVPFYDEGDAPLEEEIGQGWDGRLYTDLAALTPDALVTPNASFYIRTFYPDLLVPPDPWTIAVSGLAAPAVLELPSLLPRAQTMGPFVLECSGNHKGGGFGLLSAAAWSGVLVADVLELLDVDARATRLLVSGFDQHSVPSANGHSTPGASWVFGIEELVEAGAFLATEMNGAPLPPHHGAPVRLYVPNWYGCTCIKWVDQLVLVDDDEPATSQMMEFAARTHQDGTPALAKDYRPATMDQAAMPVRVEKWRLGAGGGILYRVVGVLWGGYEVTDALQIRFGADGAWSDVAVCPPQTQNQTWTLWTVAWAPPAPGVYAIRLRIDDPAIETKRLDSGYYEREVEIDEV